MVSIQLTVPIEFNHICFPYYGGQCLQSAACHHFLECLLSCSSEKKIHTGFKHEDEKMTTQLNYPFKSRVGIPDPQGPMETLILILFHSFRIESNRERNKRLYVL